MVDTKNIVWMLAGVAVGYFIVAKYVGK